MKKKTFELDSDWGFCTVCSCILIFGPLFNELTKEAEVGHLLLFCIGLNVSFLMLKATYEVAFDSGKVCGFGTAYVLTSTAFYVQSGDLIFSYAFLPSAAIIIVSVLMIPISIAWCVEKLENTLKKSVHKHTA